jgi:polar amino acid transport system permease protein
VLFERISKALNRVIIGFVSLMRAIPFLILAYLLYYGLPQWVLVWSPGPPV